MVTSKCPKCHGYPAIAYNRVSDMLDLLCSSCGYKWSILPMDRVRKEQEKERGELRDFLRGGRRTGEE